MKYIKLFEQFVNEALKDISLTGQDAEVIFNEIKRLTKLHKEKGFVPNVVSVDGFETGAGDFGENPDNKKFKINSIDATSFDIFVSITDTNNKVVCYVTMGYDTEKKSLKSNNMDLNFYNGSEPKFNQYAKRYKKQVYQG